MKQGHRKATFALSYTTYFLAACCPVCYHYLLFESATTITTTRQSYYRYILLTNFLTYCTMTLARTAPESFPSDIPSIADVMKGTSVSRFNLRKRNVISDNDDHDKQPQVNLSSYNSAFLSGLFADVAKVASTHPSCDATAELTEDENEEDLRQDDSVSIKRSRISLSRSISRCGRSFANLQVAMGSSSSSTTASPVSPLSPIEFFDIPATNTTSSSRRYHQSMHSTDEYEEQEPSNPTLLARENSLTFQLHCVSSSSEQEEATSPRSIVADIARIAFPHLPATVSDSSCNSSALSSGKVDQHVSASETPPSSAKEAYGWFVEMEEDDEVAPAAFLPNPLDRHAAAAKDLAFTAPTAPKQVNYDAEVEWAKAADTIDDVLGDFF